MIGGTEDAFFARAEWQDTTAALGADLVMLDGIGHQPMWEGDGDDPVGELDRFVRAL